MERRQLHASSNITSKVKVGDCIRFNWSANVPVVKIFLVRDQKEVPIATVKKSNSFKWRIPKDMNWRVSYRILIRDQEGLNRYYSSAFSVEKPESDMSSSLPVSRSSTYSTEVAKALGTPISLRTSKSPSPSTQPTTSKHLDTHKTAATSLHLTTTEPQAASKSQTYTTIPVQPTIINHSSVNDTSTATPETLSTAARAGIIAGIIVAIILGTALAVTIYYELRKRIRAWRDQRKKTENKSKEAEKHYFGSYSPDVSIERSWPELSLGRNTPKEPDNEGQFPQIWGQGHAKTPELAYMESTWDYSKNERRWELHGNSTVK